jgi:predicted ATPase
MFIGGKDLSLRDDAIEIAIEGKGLSLSALSSGEKQLLTILVATVNAGASVILVDEPELSMHVDWQRRLIQSMRTLNPIAQIIVATHSPEIMAEIPDHQVFQI